MPEPKQEKIIFNNDLYWGMSFYIANDPDQDEYKLIGVKLGPGVTNGKGGQIPSVKFHLQYMRTKIWVDDFQCSTKRDDIKYFDSQARKDDDD